MNKINQTQLKERLHYDPETGLFTWKTLSPHYRKGIIKVGDVAGTLHKLGYIHIKINSKSYKAHRLVWLYMTGEWPKHFLDHINQVKDDNRFCNLREATNAENLRNQNLSKRNTSGYRGVSWHTRVGKWQGIIGLDMKKVFVGYYDTPEDANQAVIKAREKYYGEFNVNPSHL